ncbi:MAG: arginase family protein [Candidatus Thermoplasmatota archaeon]|nr:arginase family protein [Candidatus Thermoplasmatota archaeon]
MVERMTFLGLDEPQGHPDVVILPIPYELTTSYGQGTANGPMATIEASSQVEVFDSRLSQDLPAGARFQTLAPWSSEAGTLTEQLTEIEEHLRPWLTNNDIFPLILGGEHGLLPVQMKAIISHPALEGGLSNLTIVQFDAHADLRDNLDGEQWSHACAARRSLDLGVGRIIQIGVRAWSREEASLSDSDNRIETHLASDLLSVSSGKSNWSNLLDSLRSIRGPVWITVDIDALDASLVPSTGTPVPGGLSWWHLEEAMATIFEAADADVLGADVVEIVPDSTGVLTPFTAALIATRLIGGHLLTRIR